MEKKKEFKNYGRIFELFETMTHATIEARNNEKLLIHFCREILEREYIWECGFPDQKLRSTNPFDFFREIKAGDRIDKEKKANMDQFLWDLIYGTTAIAFGVGFAIGQKYKIANPEALEEIQLLNQRIEEENLFPYYAK